MGIESFGIAPVNPRARKCPFNLFTSLTRSRFDFIIFYSTLNTSGVTMETINGICEWLLKKSNIANLSLLLAIAVMAFSRELTWTPLVVYFSSIIGLVIFASAVVFLCGGYTEPSKRSNWDDMKGMMKSFLHGIPLYFIYIVIVLEADQMLQAWFSLELSPAAILGLWLGMIVATDMLRENIFSPKVNES
jgi:hypothetical protein